MNKRDEIHGAIEQALLEYDAACDAEVMADHCLRHIDQLVERWTDEETAEDLDRKVKLDPDDVYEGMRVRVIKTGDPSRPFMATGTIVKDDRDASPGVCFDPPYEHCNKLENVYDKAKPYIYANLDKLEKLEE